jgi:CspA family cold shock protein
MMPHPDRDEARATGLFVSPIPHGFRPSVSHIVFQAPHMHSGTVRWFSYSKSCGYIIPDDGGTDVFAHVSGFGDPALPSLSQHQRVRFCVKAGPKGRVASDIRPLN